MTRTKKFLAGALAAAGMAGAATLATTAPAEAGVHVGIGIGVPGYYYGPGYYPPGPCGDPGRQRQARTWVCWRA